MEVGNIKMCCMLSRRDKQYSSKVISVNVMSLISHLFCTDLQSVTLVDYTEQKHNGSCVFSYIFNTCCQACAGLRTMLNQLCSSSSALCEEE